MILFLNKKDLFEEKIKRIPLSNWCQDYTGPPHDYKAATDFLKDVSSTFCVQKKYVVANN